ncbi:MAG: penicillin-binding protein activator [Alphaproteobacteria bacterium]
MLFNILGCQSGKNFNVFSSQDIPEEVVKDEEVLDSKKGESSFKNDLNVKVDKNKKSKKDGNLNLSDISVIGEARKDKSEIISFFFDLFDKDSDEVDPLHKERLEIKSEQKVSKESLKEKKDKIKTVIKQTKIIEGDLLEKPKDKMEKGIQSRENQRKISNTNIKDDITKREVSSKTNNIFDVNKSEAEELAFYRKKVDEKKKEDISKSKFLKVGMLLPLTGDKKAAGDLVMNSLRYSMSIKPNNLIFKIYDTKGQPSGAVKAAKEGLDEGVKLFIGPIFSDETKEINSFFSNEDAKFFSLSPDFSNVSDNVIVSGENPDDQIACIRQNLIENDLEKVLLIFPRNKYGQVIQDSFRKFQNNQDNQIKFEYFELTDSMDLNNEIKILSRYESRRIRLDEEIKRVKNDNSINKKEKDFQLKNLEKQLTLDVPYDAVVVASQGDKLVEVLSHLAFYDINSQNTFIYGTSLWEDTNKLDKVFEGSFYVTSLKKKPENFKKDFKEIFSKEPLSFNFYIYDLIDLVNQYQGFEESNKVYAGEFSNSKISSGLLKRETYLKKVLKNNEVLNISSCSLNEL